MPRRMIRRTRKFLIQLMVLTMLLSMLPALPQAEESIQPQSQIESINNKTEIPEEQNQQQSKIVKKPSEIIEERSENAKVFNNHDGTFTKKISETPLHIKKNGKWEEISSELIEYSDSKIAPKQTEINVSFDPKMKNGRYVQFTSDNQTMTYSLLDAEGELGSVKAQNVEPIIEGNTIWHKNVFADIDLRNITFNKSVKEDIVLQKYTGQNIFRFIIHTDLQAIQTEDGSIMFQNAEGQSDFILPKPFMSDSYINPESGEAARSDAVHYQIEKRKQGEYLLTLTVDAEWLKSPDRKYPVYIDPTTVDAVGGNNAFVSNAYPSMNYSSSNLWDSSLGAYLLKVGYYDGSTGWNEAFLQQDLSPLRNATIHNAAYSVYVAHHYYSNQPNGLWLNVVTSPWSEGSITWNNRPPSFNIASTNVGRGQWATFEVTNTIREWTNGSRPNYGFMLHTNWNGQTYWKKVLSSENLDGQPYLEITFSYSKPNPPRVTTVSNGTGTGTGYLNVAWDSIPGATGYRVAIFNGWSYEEFPVGNTTSWTTKNQKIWPTETEIAQGRYQMHHDGMGKELATLPSPVYKNAFLAGTPFGDYSNSQGYYVRIIAEYPLENSPISDTTLTYMPMETPKAPIGSTNANLPGTNSGYVQLQWNEVLGATGYKVLVFNGKDYEEFDVGNKTNWTTQGQKIWPTPEESATGRYQLHHDGLGSELAVDPSIVYRNSGGGPWGYYGNHKNYWFRVKAYSTTGHAESPMSAEFKPYIPLFDQGLGMKDYLSSVPVIQGLVNTTNGNVVLAETDFAISGRGPSLVVNRTYNSQDAGTGLFGKGWFSSLEEQVKEESNGDVLYTVADKFPFRFQKMVDNTYQAPAGVYLTLKKETNGFTITDKEKYVTTFSSNGNILSVKDKNGNELKYEYTNGKLTKLSDASGRFITIEYGTEGYVSKLIGPENRIVSFEYQNGYLVSSTTPRGKKYRYGYENGKLHVLYDPKHTDAKPYQTLYTYENEKLVKVTDPLGKQTLLQYNEALREVTVTNPKGRKDVYGYSEAGNPIQTTVDSDHLQLKTTFEYKGNNLINKTNPNDQGKRVSESYSYDANGNVTTATDAIGTESYQYNNNNDVTKATDTEGKTTSITYNGQNPVSTTDQESQTSSVAAYDSYGNQTQGSVALAPANNLVKDSGFTAQTGSPWKYYYWQDTGSISIDTTQQAPGLGGVSSVKIQPKTSSNTWGVAYVSQTVPVKAGQTYTLSGWIKTEALKNANVAFYIASLDQNGNRLSDGYFSKQYSNIIGTKGWTERQLTFKTTAQTKQITIELWVNHSNSLASGSAWFDNMQLEEGVVSSSYNPLLNSGFEENNGSSIGWNRWTPGGAVSKDGMGDGFSGDTSLFMERSNTSLGETSYHQEIMVNQTKAQDLTLTGMSKAEGVVNADGKSYSDSYSVWAEVYYDNNENKQYLIRFPVGTKDWNRDAVRVVAHRPIKRVVIFLVFRGGNTGKVWFDDIRLLSGNVITKNVYDGNGNYVTDTYDEEDRKTSFTYDSYGNKKTVTDPKSNTKSFDYNLDNQMTKTTLPNNTSVTYQYDDNGNTTQKTILDGTKSQVVQYEYDVDNKLTKYMDPLQRTILHTYDAHTNLIKTEMPNGGILEWTYDTADRVKDLKRNGALAFTYEYDPNGNETKVTDSVNSIVRTKSYDTGNRITSMTDRGGTVSWSYHDKSYKLKETKIVQGSYNNTSSYEYNSLDQNTKVVDGGKTFSFDYDEKGNVRTYTNGNGTASSFVYDQSNKLSELEIGTETGTLVLTEKYGYDSNGNRTLVDRTKVDGSKETISYEYDSVNQLKKETLADGTVHEFTYDGFSNQSGIKTTKPGGTVTTTTATFNNGNQLTAFGNEAITYDANGNRLTDGQFSYTWNEADQLIAVTRKGESASFATYKYDDDGRRIEKTVNGQVTRYYYDGDTINVLYETDANGVVVRHYIYDANGVRLAMKTQGQTFYYHYNAHGDVIAMTDQNGQAVARYAYDAWGNIIQQTEQGLTVDNPFKYTGYMYDEETTMYYLMARYYQPKHGVFISIDSDPGDEDDPITQNGYVYANNNPVMMIDPDGNWAVLVRVLQATLPVVAKVVQAAVKKSVGKIVTKIKGKIPNKGTGNFANKNFASRDLLESHYEKHAVKNNEFHGAYSNADEYMQGARDVMSSGTKVGYQYKGETRTGYVKFMGNSRKGEAKFEFVGTNANGDVTTYHVKRGEDLWKLLNNNKRDKTINPLE